MSQELPNTSVSQLWQTMCGVIKPSLSPAVFSTWILTNPLSSVVVSDEGVAQATFVCPTAFHATNLQKNLSELLEQSLRTILNQPVALEFVVGSLKPPAAQVNSKPATMDGVANALSLPSTPSQVPTEVMGELATQPQAAKSPRVEDLFSEHTIASVGVDRAKMRARQVGLREDYVFETFAVSTSNEMAHAAAVAVSNSPSMSYNPLFLYGGVGVGKTHLMHAIGNNILSRNPETTILYCTGEEFTNEIVQAIQTKKAGGFKNKYRSPQVLLIDDVQFIAGKNAVQEEFFHTFNALIKQMNQVVLTSDRPPHEISLLEDRLRSRFEAGLMIDIQQPSFELRTAILLVKAKASGIHLPIELAKQVASTVESARKIEGIIKSIRSEVELKGQEVSEELIARIIKNETKQAKPTLNSNPADVLRAVANHFRLKQSAIRGTDRSKPLVTARHIAMHLMKEDLAMPLVEIGRWFSNRDHTTVLHATRKINEQLQNDPLLLQNVSALRATLSG